MRNSRSRRQRTQTLWQSSRSHLLAISCLKLTLIAIPRVHPVARTRRTACTALRLAACSASAPFSPQRSTSSSPHFPNGTANPMRQAFSELILSKLNWMLPHTRTGNKYTSIYMYCMCSWRDYVVRTVTTLMMLVMFVAVIYGGPLFLVLLVRSVFSVRCSVCSAQCS